MRGVAAPRRVATSSSGFKTVEKLANNLPHLSFFTRMVTSC